MSLADKALPSIESTEEMAVQDKATLKRGAGTGPGSTSDIDSIIPLLFAAHPNLMPDYKKMAALDDHGRSNYALEHKFRKWRNASREIVEKHPEVALDTPGPTPRKGRKPRTPNGANGDDETPVVTSRPAKPSSRRLIETLETRPKAWCRCSR